MEEPKGRKEANKMSKILVVEDGPRHLADARKLLEERVKTKAIVGADYSSSLVQAIGQLKRQEYTGILSDVFFPRKDGEETEHPFGMKLAQQALAKGIPLVLVTSTYHHGIKTQPVHEWAVERGMQLVDRSPWGRHLDDREGEAQTKEWEGAYLALAYIIEGKSSGEIIITSRGLSSRDEDTFLEGNAFSLANNMDYHRQRGRLRAELQREAKNDPILKRAIEKYCRGMFN